MMEHSYGRHVPKSTSNLVAWVIYTFGVLDKCVSSRKEQHTPRLDHIAYDLAPMVCPLRLSCYNDEDAVGQVKRLAARSHPNQLGYQVLQRYAAYVCCRWLRQLTE